MRLIWTLHTNKRKSLDQFTTIYPAGAVYVARVWNKYYVNNFYINALRPIYIAINW